MSTRTGLRLASLLLKPSPLCHQSSIHGFLLKSPLHIQSRRTITSSPPYRLTGMLNTYMVTFRTAFKKLDLKSTGTGRSFTNSAINKGPRSYYGGGASGGGGRRPGGGWRAKIDAVSSNVILYSIIGLNVGVFLLWQYANSVYTQFRDPAWLRWMTNNFTSSWRNLSQGRVWTLLTCCFSHEGSGHILMNLASLYFMSGPVMMLLGNTGFLALYLFAGVASSGISLLFSRFNRQPFYQSHGASGAIYGTIAFFAAAYPRTTFLLFFIVPVPAWLCVGGIVGYDLYSAFFRRGGTTDSAGHVGGVAAGIFWYMLKSGRL